MLRRLLLIYCVVELAAVVALVSTIGFGWTVLVLLVTFVLGWVLAVPMAGSQLIHRLGRLRSAPREPQRTLRDGALLTLAAGLVVVPGLVTTALGALLLVPPVRSIAGPGLAAVTMRGLQRRADDQGQVIDGEVIDVTDAEPPPLPHGPAAEWCGDLSPQSPH